MGSQLLQPVRRGRRLCQYRPSEDWASKVARAASSTSGRYHVASAKRIEVKVEPVDHARSHVQIEVVPGTREDYLLGAVIGGSAAGIGSGVGAAILLGSAPALLAGAAAVAAGGGVAAGIAWLVGRSHRQGLAEVRDEMEGILDRLETGESLEPPPSSWRRWMRRQFEGVTRELLGHGGADDVDDGTGRAR